MLFTWSGGDGVYFYHPYHPKCPGLMILLRGPLLLLKHRPLECFNGDVPGEDPNRRGALTTRVVDNVAAVLFSNGNVRTLLRNFAHTIAQSVHVQFWVTRGADVRPPRANDDQTTPRKTSTESNHKVEKHGDGLTATMGHGEPPSGLASIQTQSETVERPCDSFVPTS
ncbi:hypothetical protein PAXINDRAFT_154939 [Paxillus involutus ATCC 200175]|nr:hypothetical protein PAXINDRAFT_154939 [Paxillus involutus ATCC 200175]